MVNAWFETVAIAQERARKRLPSSVYGALLAGTEKGISYNDNLQAFSEIQLAPRVAGLAPARDLSTTVMGQPISMPVIISPTGVLEEVVAANPQTFFQMYWMGTRETMVRRMEIAADKGAKGLILTLDWSFSHGRDWGSPVIPESVGLKTMVQFAPQVIRKPRWLLDFARNGGIPDLSAPNLRDTQGVAPTFFGAYYEWMQADLPTWEDLAWLRAQWDGPFMVKGVCRIHCDLGFKPRWKQP